MNKWEITLDSFLKTVYEPLIKNNVEYMIMGSLASVLQGCNLTPGDIDLIFQRKEDVIYLSELMKKYSLEESNEECVHFNDNWRSTHKHPVIIEEDNPKKDCWTFGRWYINDFKVEAACINPPQDYLETKDKNNGIWEGGPEIWEHIKYIQYKGYTIPVIPLEIQLETNMNRRLKHRIQEIIKIFKQQGYDQELIEKSLSHQNMKRFIDLMN